MKISFAVACLFGTASTQQVVDLGLTQDLHNCMQDLEHMIPRVESIITDLNAGSYDRALADALALLPNAEQAASDCLSSERVEQIMKVIEQLEQITGVQNLPACIADLGAISPGVQRVIADFQSGDHDSALADTLALFPDAEQAVSDCLNSERREKLMKVIEQLEQVTGVQHLPACIADLGALSPGVQRVITDFQSGDHDSALTDAFALLPGAEQAVSNCLNSERRDKLMEIIQQLEQITGIQHLPACIADLGALSPGVQQVITDFQSGDHETALTDALALLPDAEQAVSDCLNSERREKLMAIIEQLEQITGVSDLPACIADLGAISPGVARIITDVQSEDYERALTDALTLLPEAEQAFTVCTS